MDTFVWISNGFDKMAAICPDLKWLGFRISDPIQNMDHKKSRLARISDPHCSYCHKKCHTVGIQLSDMSGNWTFTVTEGPLTECLLYLSNLKKLPFVSGNQVCREQIRAWNLWKLMLVQPEASWQASPTGCCPRDCH